MKGILIGHADNAVTGVTVALSPQGAVGGVCVRGCAPGTRETDLLASENAVSVINAVVLTGGSAYGLDSCSGVMQYLREQKCGYRVGNVLVPLVAGAVIFDLGKDIIYPNSAMGYEACKASIESNPVRGAVGGGKGARVGKIRGDKYACAGGLGVATIRVAGVEVSAYVVVNAFGDVSENGKIIAGARGDDGNFINTTKCILDNDFAKLSPGGNTTIGVITTTARLTKLQANKLASIAHNGLARTISPVHTDYDGDTLFVMASGEQDCDFTMLSVASVEAVSRAIINAVK